MMTGQPSRTLLGPAVRRAAHQILDAPLVFEDPIAVGLVPEANEEAIRERIAEHQTQESILMRALFAMRSRFAEDRLREAAARGARQYVIFGAGLDTFPWRQPAFARDMQIFLADHVSSLVWTQDKFWERGLPKPKNLTLVPLDLDDAGFGDTLADYGVAPATTTFCSALGVTQYLEPNSVEAILRFVASLARGSEITFSFVPIAEDLEEADRAFAAVSAERAGGFGEPWKTRYSVAEINNLLVDLGFGTVCHLSPERAQKCYFVGRLDALRVPGWERILAAVI